MIDEATLPTCRAGMSCPQTGIWRAVAQADHPHLQSINQWWRQAFVEQGRTMPHARAWGMEAEGPIVWQLLEPGAWDNARAG